MRYLIIISLFSFSGCLHIETLDDEEEQKTLINKELKIVRNFYKNILTEHDWEKILMNFKNDIEISIIDKDSKFDIKEEIKKLGAKAWRHRQYCFRTIKDINRIKKNYSNPLIKAHKDKNIYRLCEYYNHLIKVFDLLDHKISLLEKKYKAIEKRDRIIRKRIKKVLQRKMQIAI